MTDVEREKPEVPAWRWPLEWWVDSLFWRDVASRGLAGLIVVFVAWGVGVAAGVFSDPEVVQGFGNVALGVFALLAAAMVVYLVRSVIRHTQGKSTVKRESKWTERVPVWLVLSYIIGWCGAAFLLIGEFVSQAVLGNGSFIFP